MSVRNDWIDCAHQGWCSVKLTDKIFEFRVNTPPNQQISFDMACDQAASLLHAQWNDKPLYLGLSGGMDSELVANVLLRNNIDFTPVIIDIESCNQPETWYAHHWCWRNNIKPITLDISPQRFDTEILPMTVHLRETHQFGILPLIWLSREIKSRGGYLVTAVGDINLNDQNQFFNNVVDWFIDMWDHGSHPSGFFSYTPELVVSYIQEFDMSLNEQYNKSKFYNIPPRPKINWFNQMLDISDKSKKVFSYLNRCNQKHEPYVFGSKQQTLNILHGKGLTAS